MSDLDSHQYAVGQFQPHGRSIIGSDDCVFLIKTEGPFNVEAIEAINKTRLKVLGNSPPTKPYAFLNIWSKSILASMEALAEYEKGVQYAYVNRFRPPNAMAWVVGPDVEGKFIMVPLFARIFAKVGIPFKVFEEVEKAELWISEQLQSA